MWLGSHGGMAASVLLLRDGVLSSVAGSLIRKRGTVSGSRGGWSRARRGQVESWRTAGGHGSVKVAE